MAIEGQEIEDLIREAFPDAKITITDLAGDGNHWAAEVIDASFKDKMDGKSGELHALALTTKATD
jgi:stress-induced morphogen